MNVLNLAWPVRRDPVPHQQRSGTHGEFPLTRDRGHNAFLHKTRDGILVYQPANLSKKVLTGQSVCVQIELPHGCAEAEFRRNVACAARRSFLDVGTLVYHATKTLQAHTGNLIVGGVKLPQLGELPNLGWDGACQRIFRHRLVGGGHLLQYLFIAIIPIAPCSARQTR